MSDDGRNLDFSFLTVPTASPDADPSLPLPSYGLKVAISCHDLSFSPALAMFSICNTAYATDLHLYLSETSVTVNTTSLSTHSTS